MSEKLIEGMKDDGEIDRLEMHIRDLKTD